MMTTDDFEEAKAIRARIGKNMEIIADYLRDDADAKIKRLSRALQLYQQHYELENCRQQIGGFMYMGFSRN